MWPIALGRDNGTLAGRDGDQVTAIYSLIKTAKLHGTNFHTYLSPIVKRIADHLVNCVGELLPWMP